MNRDEIPGWWLAEAFWLEQSAVMRELLSGKVGLALGSGAARGWAHIGVIRGLEAAGIVPEVVCGSSVGAIVGAAYAAGRLDEFEAWVRGLDRSSVLRNLDLSFRGGLFKGTQFFDFMSPGVPGGMIEDLSRSFGAVATDLRTGREVWLREGSLRDALRASVAMPGLITPARRGGRWLVDGGLVNPVPVSLCRALGADSVVAVDLNTIKLRQIRAPAAEKLGASPSDALLALPEADADGETVDEVAKGGGAESNLRASIESWARDLRERIAGEPKQEADALPSLYEVIANSLNIMQVHISRSRMAGDPPELLVTPRLADFALLDLDRGEEAMQEGRRAIDYALSRAY